MLKYNNSNNDTIEIWENLFEIAQNLEDFKLNQNDVFLLLMGTMVLFMQAGFAFLEAGTVRAKNTTNILLKNLLDLCFGSLAFWLVGYGLAFGEGNLFMGLQYFATIDLPYSSYSFLYFQSTFASSCATIVSGSVAERIDLYGYIIYSIILTGIIYPIGTHWSWGPDAWLSNRGFADYAGSGVIHLAGGISALTGVILIGPRIGRFKDPSKFKPHSIPLIALGIFILVFGFMAFNGGSQASVVEPGDGEKIAVAVLSTLLSCCTGGTVALILTKIGPDQNWSLIKTINGCLAGMVSICAGANDYTPWVVIIIAIIGAIINTILSNFMIKLKLDDPIDALAVHAGAGFWGLVANGIFSNSNGIIFGNGINTVLWNSIGGLIIIAWYGSTSAIIFLLLKCCNIMRVTPDMEVNGQDIVKNKEPAYIFNDTIAASLGYPGQPMNGNNKNSNFIDFGNELFVNVKSLNNNSNSSNGVFKNTVEPYPTHPLSKNVLMTALSIDN